MNKLALSLLTIGFALPLSVLPTKTSFEAAIATDENSISLSCDDNLVEGNQYYACTSLRNHEEISTLSLQIYFDEDVVAINSTYNSLSSSEMAIYDSSINDDNLSYSYIFKSNNLNKKRADIIYASPRFTTTYIHRRNVCA